MTWRRVAAIALLDLGAPVLLTIATVHELAYDGSPVAKWLGALAMVWVLVARRRFPVVTLGVCLVLAAVLWVWSDPTVADIALLVALYSVARHRPIGIAVGSAVVLEAALLAAVFRYAPARSLDDYAIVLSGVAAAALFLGTTLRSNRRYLVAVEDRAARLERDRAQQAAIGAAEERARIAREMHDIVAHGLAVVITLSEGAAATATRDPERAGTVMRQVADAGRSSLDEMRRLLDVLRTDDGTGLAPQPDLGMLDALAADVRATGLAVSLDVAVPDGALPPSAAATVFRIVQEALTNVLKHAVGASAVEVGVVLRGGRVVVRVTDDGGGGAGSGSRSAGGAGGAGLVGMRERVRMFGGTLDAGPVDGGWSVRGSFPVPS